MIGDLAKSVELTRELVLATADDDTVAALAIAERATTRQVRLMTVHLAGMVLTACTELCQGNRERGLELMRTFAEPTTETLEAG